MGKLTSHQLRDIFLITGGVGIFVYILLRVINVSMSVDEQGSYFMFVTSSQFFPETYDQWSANNHALNTFLMWVCNNLFGPDQVSLRLPNLLAGGLYIFSTAMISRRMRTPLIGVAAFVLMNSNPFMVEYFGLARGYGLASGLMAFAFWQLWIYCNSGYRWKNLALITAASVLAVFANYTYLNLVLPLTGCLFFIGLWQPSVTGISIRTKLLHAFTPVIALLGTLAIVIPIALKISAAHGFWTTWFTDFWSHSVASVIECTLMNTTNDEAVIQTIVLIVQIITVLLFARIIWWTVQQWRKKQFDLFPIVLVTIITIAVLGVMIQFWVLNTPLPVQRIGLFLVGPWLMIVAVGASLSSRFQRWIAGGLLLLSGIQLGHFVNTMSLEDMFYSPTSVQTDDALAYLRDKTSSDERILLGYDVEFWSSGMEYYRQTLPLKEFDLSRDTLAQHPLNQYLLISRQYTGKPITNNWIAEQQYINGSILYKNNAFPTEPTSRIILELIKDTITGAADGRLIYNYGGYVTDSLVAPIGTLLNISYDFVTETKSTGFMDLLVFRGDKVIYSSVVDIYPDGENQIAGTNKIVVPGLQKGDCVVASLNAFPALPREIKHFTITVEAY